MASFPPAQRREQVVVLYTVDGAEASEGTNAFRVDAQREGVLLRDFLRRFPLKGYGEHLEFRFKSLRKESTEAWLSIEDPEAVLPVWRDGNVHAKVFVPDGEGLVASDTASLDEYLPRRPSGFVAFADNVNISAPGEEAGWANFGQESAAKVAKGASALRNKASAFGEKLLKRKSKKPVKSEVGEPSDAKREKYRRQLVQFYSLHNPAKINTIEDILDRYAGREGEMFRTLQQKYPSDAITSGGTRESSSTSTNDSSLIKGAADTVKKGFWNVLSSVKSISGSVISAVGGEETVQIGSRSIAIEKQLAEGGFSTVFLGRDTSTGKKYALKRMCVQTNEQLEEAKWEIRVHRELRHPNILQIHDASIDPDPKNKNSKLVYILMPLAKNGSVFDRIEAGLAGSGAWPFPEKECLRILEKVADAVKVMHKHGWAHRDIKPHNILLFDPADIPDIPAIPGSDGAQTGEPVLMDLGSTGPVTVEVRSRRDAMLLQDMAASKCSPPYRAPEFFEVPPEIDIDGRTDVFSLGGTIYAMAFGRSPFELPNEGFMKLALLNGVVAIPEGNVGPLGDRFSDAFCDLIKGMLRSNPSKRYKISKVLRIVRGMLQS
jgi:serine/threonine kinase 16